MKPTKPIGDLSTANLILVRHGESASNAGLKTSSNEEIPLTSLGLEQARQAAQLLANAMPEPTVIYSSPFLRAYQTAKPYSHLVNQPITLESDWHEINYLDPAIVGDSTYGGRQQYRDEFWRNAQTNPDYHAPSKSNRTQPESVIEFVARINFALRDLLIKYPNSPEFKAIIFTHEFVISTAIDLLNGLDKTQVVNGLLEHRGPVHRIANCQIVGFHI